MFHLAINKPTLSRCFITKNKIKTQKAEAELPHRKEVICY